MKKLFFIGLCVILFDCAKAQMTSAELGQIEELNLMRTNPSEYAVILRKHSQNKMLDSMSVWIINNELIPLFDTMQPLRPLIPSAELRQYAETFRGFDTVKGYMWHDMGYYDLSSEWRSGGQNLTMAAVPNPRAQILALMIDVCLSDRGHRIVFLEPSFTHVSVRIIKFWGDEAKPFSCLFGFVYDLRSKEKAAMQSFSKKYPILSGCGDAKPFR